MDDLFRRLMGLPPRRNSEDPRNIEPPSNVEPPNNNNRHYFEDFFSDRSNHGHSTIFGPTDDEFNSIFEKIERDFEKMSSLFGNFHNFHHRPIEGHPNESIDSVPENPRNTLLKDDPPKHDEDQLHPNFPQPPLTESDDMRSFGEVDVFVNPSFDPFNPFSMMDQMIKGFSGIAITPPEFHHHGNEEIPLGSRESLLKKDFDLDDKNLPPEGPGYSYPSQPVQPHSHQTFRSSSIVRIRRPDGTIEEKRTFKDSSGREEITTTIIDPSDSNYNGSPGMPNLPPDQCVIS